MDPENDLQRGVFFKRAHVVDGFERSQNFRTLGFRKDRPTLTLQPSDRIVAIDRHNQSIAQLPSLLQQINMPGMKHIETAVGKDDALAGSLQALNRLRHGRLGP